jgi:hypothetical protein
MLCVYVLRDGRNGREIVRIDLQLDLAAYGGAALDGQRMTEGTAQ